MCQAFAESWAYGSEQTGESLSQGGHGYYVEKLYTKQEMISFTRDKGFDRGYTGRYRSI